MAGRQLWKEWSENENNLAVLEAWARAGMTDEQIAKNIGVRRSTLSEWKKKHENIRTALSVGKEFADRMVENSLFGMTQGRMVKVQKAFKLRKVNYDQSGKKTSEEEYLDTVEEDYYIEPDIKAIMFWLKNRMPEQWKEKVADMPNGGDDGGRTGMVILTQRKAQELQEEIRKNESEEKR